MKKILLTIFIVCVLGLPITAIAAMHGFQHFEVTVKILLTTQMVSSGLFMIISM